MVVPGRGPPSWVTRVPSGSGTGVISRSKNPFFCASTARFCEMTAYSSMASRLTPNCSATFSAVTPMAMYISLTKSGRVLSRKRGLRSSTENPLPLVRLTDSTPPATYVLPSPALMAWNAMRMDCSDEAQKRFTDVPGTVSGRPARAPMHRAMLKPCSPAWLAAPMMTSSTEASSSVGTLAISSLMMKPPMSSALTSLSEPLWARPIGVRAVATITASGIGRSPWRSDFPDHSAAGARTWPTPSGRCGLLRFWRRHAELGGLDGGPLRPAAPANGRQFPEEGDGAGVVVAGPALNGSILEHLDKDFPAQVGADDGE